jgi:hypothetical protein
LNWFLLIDAVTNFLHVFVMDFVRVRQMVMWQLYGKFCVLLYLLIVWSDRAPSICLYFLLSVFIGLLQACLVSQLQESNQERSVGDWVKMYGTLSFGLKT